LFALEGDFFFFNFMCFSIVSLQFYLSVGSLHYRQFKGNSCVQINKQLQITGYTADTQKIR